ncbi:MAG: dihydroorotase [Microbacteriaceae bacterium]|nr:dihydroorotase [Microbacteriaceae bacterium]
MSEILIKNVHLAASQTRPGSEITGETRDIRVAEGKIAEVGTGLAASETAQIIDGTGLLAFTGFVDLHTHLREPGMPQAETVYTGTRAAAAGGFTTVFAMANTDPVADTASVVEQVASLGDDAGYATVRPIGAVTKGLAGTQLSDIGEMAQSRAKVRVFSDDGKCVHDSLLMRRALEYIKSFDGVLAQHAQDPRLTEGAQMNEGPLASELGLTGWPAVAEESIIARDALLAEHIGARLHICHLSTAGSVEVVRQAKERGVQVTAEVTPHHLLLTEDLLRDYDARFKVNPPLRRESDVQALRQAVAEGIIDIIATDHAPHPPEAKACEFEHAAFGMIGLESAFGIAQLALIETGHISWARLEEMLSKTPAKIGSFSEQPQALQVGEFADITLVDPRAGHVFGLENVRSRSNNSPFFGVEVPGSIHTTIRRGKITCLAGKVAEL